MDILSVQQMWLIAGVLLLCCEMLDGTFLVSCFAMGAFFASVAATCGLGLTWQLAFFAVASLVAFLCVRPLAKRFLHDKNKREQHMQMDLMAGREAVVVEEVTANGGRVAIDGTDWKAVGEVGTTIAVGTKVTIKSREGNTLIVELPIHNS